ncbi:MAG: gamma-glutamylcyclotransferase family protein [Gemmatimonadales bacterium]
MAERCPGARVVGRASLPNHRFQIGAAGYGTVIPDARGEVPGLLWELTSDDESALDRYEGMSEGRVFRRRGTWSGSSRSRRGSISRRPTLRPSAPWSRLARFRYAVRRSIASPVRSGFRPSRSGHLSRGAVSGSGGRGSG